MRFASTFLLALLLPIIALAVDPPAKGGKTVKGPPKPAITQLDWLSGRWRVEKAGRVTEEQWMAPAGGVMLGMSRTVAKGRLVESEFLQIREGPGGDLFYVALPSGQKEAAFQLLSLSPLEVIFENKEHDFPQRIVYARQADGGVLAAIEGPGPGGVTRRVEFMYKRAD